MAVQALVPVTHDAMAALFERAIDNVRDEMIENPYLIEALRVLPVRGYRSAIGNVWNAIVDDLRNKIIHRSLSLFNKAVPHLRREVKRYDDFQDYVNDDDLIEGAYEIGVIDWEATKVLKHAKETRHVLSGHPRSSEPSAVNGVSGPVVFQAPCQHGGIAGGPAAAAVGRALGRSPPPRRPGRLHECNSRWNRVLRLVA